MSETLQSVSLKLYSHGLSRLFDPNWTGLELFYYLKSPSRGGEYFHRTKRDGLLYYIGRCLVEEYFFARGEECSSPALPLSGEHLIWYLEDFLELLAFHQADPDTKAWGKAQNLLSRFDDDPDEEEWYKYSETKKGQRKVGRRIAKLRDTYSDDLEKVSEDYAYSFAHRAFHDRELCRHISEVIWTIGYPGEDRAEQWVERRAFPAWTVRVVQARERGKCANCSADIAAELEADPNIDHVIPLAKGGHNDLLNLQMLCRKCNAKKSAEMWPVASSIPRYFQKRS